MQKTEKEKIIEIIQNEDIGEYTFNDFKDSKYGLIFSILKPTNPFVKKWINEIMDKAWAKKIAADALSEQ